MKLTGIILLAACLQVSAKGVSQTVTISVKDAPLITVLTEIRKQTGYSFFADNKQLEKAKKISLSVNNIPLLQVLETCFKDQPLTYTIIDKVINVYPKKESSYESGVTDQTEFEGKDINGIITDENGAPVEGVNVLVKGTNKGTTTNLKGQFVLNNVDEDAVLFITSVGYNKEEIAVKNTTFIAVQLKVAIGNLDELQVIAYGTTSKRLNTGNIATVKASDIGKQPVNNPLLALQGRVPGLFITQSTGLPGSGVVVRIQGQNSIGKGNEPLYVVDGVPYISQLLPTIINILGTSGGLAVNGAIGSGSPFSYINPSEIESIDVLKDADATSIYGSRAANGAILITTKKGKAGQTRVNINIQNGWGKVSEKLDLLDTQQYLDMRKEAFQNDGLVVPTTSTVPNFFNYDLTVWDQNRNTDWQEKLIGGTSQYTDINANVSGGNANTQFMIGTGYHKETTVFPGSLDDKKGAINFNISNVSYNQKFRIQLSGNYLVDDNHLIISDLTETAIKLPPNAPSLYNIDGSINWAVTSNGSSTWQNPLSYLNNKYNNKTKNLISNAIISYKILQGLDVKSSFGYTNMQTNEIITSPLTSIAPEYRPFSQRYSLFADGTINSWIFEPQADYNISLGKGRLSVLIGATILQNKSNRKDFLALGYNSDLVLDDIKSAPTLIVRSTISSVYNYSALFGRLNYALEDKYILNLTARRDGSSRFGSNNLFHNFGSVAFAWLFSNEGFIRKNLPFMSFGKLRASYGTTGNDQIGDYQFMSLYQPIGVPTSYQGTSGIQPSGLTNPYIQWEETKKLQFGLEVGLLADRILFNMNYFQNRSSNQLLAYDLPFTTGFGNILRNFPATVQNTGWELSTSFVNFKSKNFSWKTSINLTIPKNKLVDFPNLATSSYAIGLQIGQPITLATVYNFRGVDDATGIYQFENGEGNLTSRPDTSFATSIHYINTSPKFYGGFENVFRFREFELDLTFQFVKQIGRNYILGNQPGFYIGGPFIANGNQPVSVLERWQKSGDISSIQKFSSTYPFFTMGYPFFNATGSDASFSDASYIRLKNLSFSWQLPEKWRNKIRLQNARIYLQCQNLLTITNYKGLDPETQSSTTLPPLRVLTIGLHVTL